MRIVDQASGVNVLENIDAEIVDYDVLDDDCEVSDECLSLELGAYSTSTDDESIEDSELAISPMHLTLIMKVVTAMQLILMLNQWTTTAKKKIYLVGIISKGMII